MNVWNRRCERFGGFFPRTAMFPSQYEALSVMRGGCMEFSEYRGGIDCTFRMHFADDISESLQYKSGARGQSTVILRLQGAGIRRN